MHISVNSRRNSIFRADMNFSFGMALPVASKTCRIIIPMKGLKPKGALLQFGRSKVQKGFYTFLAESLAMRSTEGSKIMLNNV